MLCMVSIEIKINFILGWDIVMGGFEVFVFVQIINVMVMKCRLYIEFWG